MESGNRHAALDDGPNRNRRLALADDRTTIISVDRNKVLAAHRYETRRPVPTIRPTLGSTACRVQGSHRLNSALRARLGKHNWGTDSAPYRSVAEQRVELANSNSVLERSKRRYDTLETSYVRMKALSRLSDTLSLDRL